jgi:hypothetical protein
LSVRLGLCVALAATLLGVAPVHAGTIEGRIAHASKPEAVAGLVVQAIGIDASEKTIQRETRADAEGRYRFENLPAPAAYLVRARYGELVFPGGSAVFRPGEPELSHTVDFQVYDSSDDASRLRIASLQWVIGRSAGVWRVNQNAVVANPDPAVVVAAPEAAPVLRIALAPGHGDVETMFGRLPDGVVIRDGVAEIRGPILPGPDGFTLQLAYDLPAPDTALETTIALPDAVDQLGVYVQDFGIDVNAGVLHPARPTRENDMIYQSFLGFELPAGSVLPLRVTALPPLFPLPQTVVALIAALLAGGLLFFVAGPLALASRGASASASAPAAAEESPAKAALEAALVDLEHDFETGKLSADDRDRLRDDLRREAVGALARERGQLEGAPAASTAATPAARVCACGREAQAHDRFCAACGKAL